MLLIDSFLGGISTVHRILNGKERGCASTFLQMGDGLGDLRSFIGIGSLGGSSDRKVASHGTAYFHDRQIPHSSILFTHYSSSSPPSMDEDRKTPSTPLMESARSFQASNEEETALSGSQHKQKAMIEACESGDVSSLQKLLEACHVRAGDAPVDPKYGEPDPLQSAPPPTWKLLTAAVRHGQSPIAALILKTYPTVDLNRQSILEAAIAKPHLETFKLLHAQSPSIVDYEFDSLNTSLLMEACRGGNPLLPNYLLDNRADPNEGGFPGAGPLFFAVRFEQPLSIIVKMVNRGALVTNAVLTEAIRKQRAPILEFLLTRGGLKDRQRALESAHETGDKEIIALVERAGVPT